MDSSKIEEITSLICDEYCKYPITIHDEEQLVHICDKCPLCKLMEDMAGNEH